MGDGPTNIFKINISRIKYFLCERDLWGERVQSFPRFVKQQFGHQLSITLFVPQNISVHPHLLTLYRRGTGTVLAQRVTLLNSVSLLACSCSMFLSMCQ